MEKLKESESILNPPPKKSTSNDPMDEFLSQMGELGKFAEGEGGEQQLQDMLEVMMGQLMTKDVLYEPLKELAEKVCAVLAHYISLHP